MATVSGQLQDSHIKGKPRDLMSVIFDVSPTDTPFLTMCGRSKAIQTLHEWQTDTLATPAVNSTLEGADVTTFTESTTTELSNKTQILSKAVSVSGTAQAVKQEGVSKQYNYQLAQRTKELKKDVELALLSNQVARSDDGSNGRLMRGLPTWMPAANSDVAGTIGSDSIACVAGTTREATQALFTGVLTKIYEAGGEPVRIMCAPDIRVALSSVLRGTANNRMENAESKRATGVIDVYVSDFGALKIIPNRVQAYESFSKTCAFILDPDYWKVAYLRGFQEQPLARTGDSMKGQVLVECTLEARNPASSGMVADLKV